MNLIQIVLSARCWVHTGNTAERCLPSSLRLLYRLSMWRNLHLLFHLITFFLLCLTKRVLIDVLQCGHGFARNENGRCTGRLKKQISCVSTFLSPEEKCLYLRCPSLFSSDKDECTQFPSVCPSDRPVCTNTYGSYKCRSKRRCNQGFEPNDDGSACVGEWSGADLAGLPRS